MAAQSFANSAFLALIVIFFFLSSSSTAQDVENEREFDYHPWSKKGPGRWGELKKEWEKCSNGRMQSPIDLSAGRVKAVLNSGDLKRRYKPSNASLLNRGHDISIKFMGDAGSVKIAGFDYHLRQCHWHSPSEHTINGRRYDLELHMVHETTDPKAKSKIAVLGLLYKIRPVPDYFLFKMRRNILGMIVNEKEEIRIGEIDPSAISRQYRKYYRYMGSLTIPPCTEGVSWIINKRIMPVSWQQVKLLRLAVDDYAEKNARPLQELNRREIYLHRQNSRLKKRVFL